MELKKVVLVDGVRSAFARGARGKLVATRLDDAGATILRALLDRNPLVSDSMIEDVGLGNVLGPAEFTYIGTVPKLAGLPHEVCSFNANRQCGSSMEAMHRLAMGIMVGNIECGVAMGIERMGRTIGGAGARTRITKTNAKVAENNDVQRALAADHKKYFSVDFPGYILRSPWLQSMPQTAQNVAEVYQLDRAAMDAYSAESHKKTAAAYEAGIYRDEVIPLEVEDPIFDDEGNWLEQEVGKKIIFDRDECVRGETTAEKLAGLKPIKGITSFAGKEIVITPGNSCPTNDGISATLVMSEEKAIKLGITPLARIVGMAVGGIKPQLMGLGPIVASKKAFEKSGITADQIDRVELNEAFAAQVLPSLKELGIPAEKVNVNGGALAIGHPLGATGARLVMAVAKELRRSNKRYGLATQCIGAGMGIATILERMD
jgi:acetyl-CoA acetyltransferase family protein